MPHFHFIRPSLSLAAFGAVTLVMSLGMGGCSTPIQRDVYEQKLAGEVRVLEDQLYDADYQNRVLRDRLEQCRNAKSCDPGDADERLSAPSSASGPAFLHNDPGPVPDSFDGGMQSDSFDSGDATFQDFVPPQPLPTNQALETDDWGTIEIDSGEPIISSQPGNGSAVTSEASTMTPSAVAGDASASEGRVLLPTPTPEADSGSWSTSSPQKLSDPPSLPSNPSMTEETLSLPPAPTEPQPPGKQDLRVPALIPGDIQPPPGDPGADLLPPGKIELPEGIKDDAPVDIQIHPQFTGGSADDSGSVDQIHGRGSRHGRQWEDGPT